ncbi:BTAD domain-containing putative transcriptional regulator [Nonomuraea antimicrobica]|uniref:BTAD domain-containing putative transcriptional regulator n=1 Tax=Nonomuraea antimicrobica TaxID=561173 RepID=A0ABP7DRC5_9ACTN
MGIKAEFRLLGPLEVVVDGGRLSVGGPRQQRLLATLLLNPVEIVSTSRLIDELWGEDPPDTAREQVHNAVARLRRSLGPAGRLLATEGSGYRLRVDGEQVDSHRFGRAVEAARLSAEAGEPAAAAQTLASALDLWRGPALQGLTGNAIEAAAMGLDQQRLAAREQLLECRLALGEAAELVPELTGLVAEHPFRETLRRQHIVALYRSGQQSDALDSYERTRALLADELGLDPGPELRLLHEQLLRNDPALDAPAKPSPGQARPAARNCLPYDIADFTGRAAEVRRLLELTGTATDTAVVITALDGMAGIGKTTLAVHIAHLLADDYPDGQLFIDLHGYTPGQRPLAPAAALDVLLDGLGVPPERIPRDFEQRVAKWRSDLAGRRVLVILDNAKDAQQVRGLLPGAPTVRVLVTSRRRMSALEGASSFSLELMPPDDAVKLFLRVAGAERVAGEPEQVAEVVELCGYLPLAIRIATSRFRHRPTWTVAYLADRLRDERRRLLELATEDRSVLAAFTVSYRHLAPAQRRLFRLLGLHPGADFDVYGAAALVDAAAGEVEPLLEELLDVHLLAQHAVGRYHFHDLLRQYARATAEREESPEERSAAMARLAEHYLHLGHAAEQVFDPGRHLGELVLGRRSELPELPAPAAVRDVIAAERLNFVEVVGHAAGTGAHSHAWRLAAALGPLLQRHGYSDEAFDVYDQGLRAARECADWGGQATLYRHLGVARLGTGDFGDALAALRESLALEREVHGDGPGSARVLSNMAIVHIRLGRFADAQEHLHRALDLLGTDGSAHDRAFFLANLGVVNTKLGRYEEAAACVLRALDIQTGLGNRFAEMLCLVNAGWIYTLSGRLPDARDHLERGLALGRQLGAKEAEARALYLLADCLRRQDENTAALTGARRALVLARQIQDADAESQTLNVLGQVHHALGDPEAARDCYGQVLRLGLEVKAVPAHRGLGRLALDEGDRAAARAHWTKAQAIAEGAGLPEAEEIARDIAALDRS